MCISARGCGMLCECVDAGQPFSNQLHLPVTLLMRTSKFTIIADTPPDVMLVCVLLNSHSCCTPRSGSG